MCALVTGVQTCALPIYPGLSKFYHCLDDDLLRIFGPDTLFSKMMNKNLEDGEAIGSKWLSKAIETAQKKVEARNYDIRKQVRSDESRVGQACVSTCRSRWWTCH